MRRTGTVSVPGMVLGAALCIGLILLPPNPSGAQDASDDPLDGRSATLLDRDGDGTTDRISIPASGCEVGEDATISMNNANGNPVRLVDGQDVEIKAAQDRVTVRAMDQKTGIEGLTQGTGNDGNVEGRNARADGEVRNSSGISCDRDNGDDGDGGTANGLLDLDCDELLERSRDINGNGGQYGEGFADPDVQDQIVVCLEQEVINDTAADEDLPDTGGLPLLGLAVLGLASVVAGASVIRGVGRGG